MLGNTWFNDTRPLSLLSAYTWMPVTKSLWAVTWATWWQRSRSLCSSLSRVTQGNNCPDQSLNRSWTGSSKASSQLLQNWWNSLPTLISAHNALPCREEKEIHSSSQWGKCPWDVWCRRTILPLPHSLGSVKSKMLQYSTLRAWSLGSDLAQILSLPLTCCLP